MAGLDGKIKLLSFTKDQAQKPCDKIKFQSFMTKQNCCELSATELYFHALLHVVTVRTLPTSDPTFEISHGLPNILTMKLILTRYKIGKRSKFFVVSGYKTSKSSRMIF